MLMSYLSVSVVKNLSNASITSYQNKVQPFVDYCDGSLISSITIDTIDGFTNLLKTEHHVNDVSVVSYLRSVRAFLYYCMECNYMTTFKIHLPKAQKEIKETYICPKLDTFWRWYCTIENYIRSQQYCGHKWISCYVWSRLADGFWEIWSVG